MSHTIIHTEEWEEESCDNCNHEESSHHKIPRKVIIQPGDEYIAFGCMVLKKGGRQLEGQHSDCLRRCECVEFK